MSSLLRHPRGLPIVAAAAAIALGLLAFAAAADARGQATKLRKTLRRLARARKKFKIEKVIWYTWLSREGSSNPFDWSGLRRVRGDRLASAPALAAFRSAARSLARG